MSKFYPWINDDKVADSGDKPNVLSPSALSTDSQKVNGFISGTPISSLRINTALRQANLVVAALMDAIDSENTLDLTSTQSAVKNVIDTYFGQFAKASTLGTLATKDKVDTTDFAANAKCPNATKADSATNATNATIATYASADTSKGTIEERLTALGFKEGNVKNSSGDIVLKLFRQGNYVIAIYNGYRNNYQNDLGELNGKQVPANFKPKEDITFIKTGIVNVATVGGQSVPLQTEGTISINGDIVIDNPDLGRMALIPINNLMFGYEAAPISQ